MTIKTDISKLNKESLERKLREDLAKFPLYSTEHFVLVHINGSIFIGYGESPDRIESRDKTRFDLQITDRTCYILSFIIEEAKRKQGNGTCLLALIENFCSRELNTKLFQVTPSGVSKDECFYEHRGYKPINDTELAKDL